jgi:hypothetical protein
LASSQEVESLRDALAELDLARFFAEVHEELCDFVRVHAGSRHLDGAGPVVVVVAKVEGELLNHCFFDERVVEGNIEVSWKDAPLGCELRDEVEIVLTLRVLILHDLGINEGTRGRVDELATAILNEEALSDALVHDDDCDRRLLLGCVVGLLDGLAELLHLLLEDLTSHGIANTITVDDEVLRVVSMSLCEGTESALDSILELLVDDLLSLPLSDPLTVVLASGLVNTGAETNY